MENLIFLSISLKKKIPKEFQNGKSHIFVNFTKKENPEGISEWKISYFCQLH